jgi:hypothetical protein
VELYIHFRSFYMIAVVKGTKPTFDPVWLLLHACLFALRFGQEDGDSTFLQKVCKLLPDYTAPQHRSHQREKHKSDIDMYHIMFQKLDNWNM